MSWSDDKIEQITAKSIAVSSIFIPPVIFRNTSFIPSRNPHFFSKTASNIFNLFVSNPVADLWGVPYTAELTRDCISTSKGLAPSIVAAIPTPLVGFSLSETRISEGLLTCLSPF